MRPEWIITQLTTGLDEQAAAAAVSIATVLCTQLGIHVAWLQRERREMSEGGVCTNA